MADVIQALWIGDRLSSMEQLCIASFCVTAIPYTCTCIRKPPAFQKAQRCWMETACCPRGRIFMYSEHRTYAVFCKFLPLQVAA